MREGNTCNLCLQVHFFADIGRRNANGNNRRGSIHSAEQFGNRNRATETELLQALLFPLEVQEGGDAARDQQVVQRLRFSFKGRGFRGP